MSNPRVKRPFAGAASDPSQRQITSFFSTRSPTDSPIAPEGVRSPPLPANIESNLLSVGMRIRKSVPEGYKVAGHSAFKLWTDNSTTAAAAERPANYTAPSAGNGARSVSRELLPFCGINRVGGLDTQPDVRVDSEDELPALDDIPELTMSQESNDSVESSGNTRKRFFTEDADELVDPAQAWVTDTDEEGVSPRTLVSGGFGNARVMAVPRSRAAKAAGAAPVQVKQALDQENMAMDGGDFEEADFLVGREMDMTA